VQVLANLALVITEEESPSIRDWLTWRDIFHVVDIVCCCAILFPIVWSIKQVRLHAPPGGGIGGCGCGSLIDFVVSKSRCALPPPGGAGGVSAGVALTRVGGGGTAVGGGSLGVVK
jgi:hypothetical protein